MGNKGTAAGRRNEEKSRRIFHTGISVVSITGKSRLIRIEEGERKPLEYTIVKLTDLPQEALEFIEQKKEKEFQMTYRVGDDLYLMKGYGVQMTGGYSIQVEEMSESENAVFCRTRLLGPSKEDQGGEPSCPCIVLKIKNTTKPVEFF